jgi:hypothetical protein
MRDYYVVTKGFPLVSAPVAESELDDFKGANICLIDFNFLGSLIVEKLEIAEWKWLPDCDI